MPYTGISANSKYWAAASGIEADTYKQQLDEKINWIEEIYNDKKTQFTISEMITELEVENTLGINYLYNNSDVYKNMSKMQDSQFIIADSTMFLSLGVEGTSYTRNAFYIESDGILKIQANYSLGKGKMAIWIVDPEGTIQFKGNMTNEYNEEISLNVSKGLWSVVTVCEYEDRHINGSKYIKAILN